jgi:aryl-alcohol dehydrogenase-like predicted oxidoreductase
VLAAGTSAAGAAIDARAGWPGARRARRVGYGAMQLTGPKVWGEYPDHDHGVALLREVVAEGVTFIDTADVYGPHSNEELIREALHPYPGDLVIATKGGFVRGGPEYNEMSAVGNRRYLPQAAYMSMRRLGWATST